MINATLLHDAQRFPDDALDTPALYRLMLEQATFADEHGFTAITFPEHHGAELGYLPSPLVMAAAVAAATTDVRLALAAVIAPLHDPLHLAEDLAVLDLVSAGRVELVLGAGYVPAEFAMFGADLGDRPASVEHAVEVLRRAWTGDSFEHRGTTVRVRPRPCQDPLPILLGGSSPGAARRAARIADGFRPTSPDLWEPYRAECLALGRPDPGAAPGSGPFVLHVAEDPERARAQVGPAIVRGANQYLELAAIASGGPALTVSALEDLEAFGMARVVDPDGAVAICSELGTGTVVLQPRFGGIAPDLGWASLELFATKVLPRITQLTAGAPATGHEQGGTP